MPAHFAEVLLRVYTKDVRLVDSPNSVTDLITELRLKFLWHRTGWLPLLASSHSEGIGTDVHRRAGLRIRWYTRTIPHPKDVLACIEFQQEFQCGTG
jgi:hypothetical protein